MAVPAVVGRQRREDAEADDEHVRDVLGWAIRLHRVAGLRGGARRGMRRTGNISVAIGFPLRALCLCPVLRERIRAQQDPTVVEDRHDVAVVGVHVGAPNAALVHVLVVVELVAGDAHVDGAVEMVADEFGQQRHCNGHGRVAEVELCHLRLWR